MAALGQLLPIFESSMLLPHFRFQASSRGWHPLPCYQAYAATSTDYRSVCFLRIRSDPGVLSWMICAQLPQQKGFSRGIKASVVPDSKVPITSTVDSAGEGIDIQLDTSGGGDNIDSAGGSGSGDGRGGGNNWGSNKKGEGGSDESEDHNTDKGNKMAMSMSQKLTLGYAALVGVGGVMGYLKSGSQKSLIAGGLSALLLYCVYTQLPTKPVLASSLGLGLSAALLGVMGSRFKNSGKIFPAGVVSFVSLVMTGGYLHGIMRSMH